MLTRWKLSLANHTDANLYNTASSLSHSLTTRWWFKWGFIFFSRYICAFRCRKTFHSVTTHSFVFGSQLLPWDCMVEDKNWMWEFKNNTTIMKYFRLFVEPDRLHQLCVVHSRETLVFKVSSIDVLETTGWHLKLVQFNFKVRVSIEMNEAHFYYFESEVQCFGFCFYVLFPHSNRLYMAIVVIWRKKNKYDIKK